MRLYRAIGLFAIALLFTPSVALAHAFPVQSDPAPNATLARAPTQVEIAFSEALEANLSRVTVYNAQKQLVQNGPSRVVPNNPNLIVAPLAPNLPNGSYTVVWHVVAAEDGHGTAGVFVFGVGSPPEASVVSPRTLGAEQGSQATPIGVIGRWLVYLGAVLTLGVASFALLMNGKRPGARPVPRLLALLALAIAFLVLGQILRLFDELALSFGEPAFTALRGGRLGMLLFGSRFGWLWLGRSGLVAIAGFTIARHWLRRAATLTDRRAIGRGFWMGCLAVGTGLVLELAWSGHAADGNILAYVSLIQATLGWSTWSDQYLTVAASLVGAARTLTLVVDWLHLVAVSVWIGGTVALAVTTWGIGPDVIAGEDRSAWVGVAIARFSRVAAVSVVLVLLTGLYNTWLNLAGPDSYLTTGYGQSLLLKHAIILALLVLAASNQLVTVPVLTGRKTASDFPRLLRSSLVRTPLRTVQIEAALGILVLLSTGLLTSLAPARSPQQILLDPTVELALATAPGEASPARPSDPRAGRLLAGARDTMARLRSARMTETLSDGAGGLSLTEYTFVKPDRVKIVSPNGGAVIQIGSTVYTRQKGSVHWTVEPGATPYLWPTGEFDYLTLGVSATVLGARSIDGHPCTVVAFYAPRSEAIYEDWIGVRDHLIYQEIMVAPSHFMVDRYQDFDATTTIEAPRLGPR